MTGLSVMVDGLPPGTPTALDIVSVETGVAREAVVVSGRSYRTHVPGGTYLMRLTPPGPQGPDSVRTHRLCTPRASSGRR